MQYFHLSSDHLSESLSLRENLGISYLDLSLQDPPTLFSGHSVPGLILFIPQAKILQIFLLVPLCHYWCGSSKVFGSKLKTVNTGIHFIKLPSSECVLHTTWATDVTLQYHTVLFFKLYILFIVIFWERSSLVRSQTDNIIRSLPILP